MLCTCPACGRKAHADPDVREVLCDCGRRYDPAQRPTVADPFLGEHLGGYRVEELIGAGGMGTVYRATQLSLGRPVAVKILPPNVADDPQFVRRFHREAEVLASLNHPGIVQVIDRGEAEGRYFLVMELVEGTNLRELVRRGPIEPRQALKIAAAVLDALDYAHARGVVHRDVKPENVLVREDGVVKVADFGLSRVLVGADPADPRLTHTSLVLGTFEYMAPEQREQSRAADARADLYAASVVVYEMLTGELPIGRFPLPSERVPGLDARLDAILERGLAKDPDARFPRASAMARALDGARSAPEQGGLGAGKNRGVGAGKNRGPGAGEGTGTGAPDNRVDLDRLRATAARLAGETARAVREAAGGAADAVRDAVQEWRRGRRPTAAAVDRRLDLLLTVLGTFGFLALLGGIVVGVEGGRLEDWWLAAYGGLLWQAAERARAYRPWARAALLVLSGMLAITVVGLPLTIWTWRTLLDEDVRAYVDARWRGLDPLEAITVVRDEPLPPRPRPEALARRARAARANRTASIACAVAGAAAGLGWTATEFHTRDEGAFLLGACLLLLACALFFRRLRRRVEQGRALRLNAWTWTALGWLAPAAGRRARIVRRDARQGLA